MKKILKVIIWVMGIVVIVGTILLTALTDISTNMHKQSENRKYYDRALATVPNADYIVVPGAKIMKSMPGRMLCHRLEYAYMLYQEKKAPKIIVSGGFDEEVGKYEAEIMYQYLIQLGVKEQDIILDLYGNSTYETIKRVKEQVKDKSVIFCTQEMYSDRAIYIAQKLNLNMNVFCSDPMIYERKGRKLLRETLAKAKAVLDCTIFPRKTRQIHTTPFYRVENSEIVEAR